MSKRPLVSLVELIDALRIDKWDLLLVGDGSGSVPGRPTGWACVAYDKELDTKTLWYGASSSGSNNAAECSAYIAPLVNYQNRISDSDVARLRRVVIVSDSEYTVKLINCSTRPKKNQIYWGIFNSARSSGLLVVAHWLRREASIANSVADRVSKEARLALSQHLDATDYLEAISCI